jgi:hypothetical protein
MDLVVAGELVWANATGVLPKLKHRALQPDVWWRDKGELCELVRLVDVWLCGLQQLELASPSLHGMAVVVANMEKVERGGKMMARADQGHKGAAGRVDKGYGARYSYYSGY